MRVAPRLALCLAVLIASSALVACGGDDDSSGGVPDDCTQVTGGAYTLVAENIEWNTECLVVPPDEPITFTVDLRDTSVEHNLAIGGPEGPKKTKLETGPKTQTLEYTFGLADQYTFVCDLHPNMEGTVYVDRPETAGG